MKKRILALFVFFLLSMGCFSCGEPETAPEPEPDLRSEKEQLLSQNSWHHFDFASNENEIFSCNKKNHFAYYWASGNPIGDYDLFDSYRFDEDKNTILVSGPDMTQSISVLSFNETHLLLNIEGKIKDFYNPDYAFAIPNISNEYLSETDNYTGFNYFVSMNEDSVVLNTAVYDGDMRDVYAPFDETYLFSEDVTFQSMKVETAATEEGKTSEYFLTPLSMDEAISFVENSAAGFVWINENSEVYKVLFYGETTIYK